MGMYCVVIELWKSESVGKVEVKWNIVCKSILVSGTIHACPLLFNKSLVIFLYKAKVQSFKTGRLRDRGRSLLGKPFWSHHPHGVTWRQGHTLTVSVCSWKPITAGIGMPLAVFMK